ncbi:TPA: oligosaccharide flippase family protein, partial [Streptococcus agalactiae]
MKLLKNMFYNTSYQLLTLLLPLVTVPYVSRVLSPQGIGINA